MGRVLPREAHALGLRSGHLMAKSKISGRIELRLSKEGLQEAKMPVVDVTAIDELERREEDKAARFREDLSRRWRPWATYIELGRERAWPSGTIVACTGCGLTTAASTARKTLHEVRYCPKCEGKGSGEWCGERVHLTRARKKWECEHCSAGIEPDSLYIVLGLRGSPAPKVIGKWPDVPRLCVECWQRI